MMTGGVHSRKRDPNSYSRFADAVQSIRRRHRHLEEAELRRDRSMQQHGPWTILSTQTVYRDPWLAVHRDEVIRPDGGPGSYATVEIKAGVCVLAVDRELNAYLTSEFHYAVGRITQEAVSGGIDPGESPREAAARELREELGIAAGTLIELGWIDPFTASIRSPTTLFLAQDLSFGQSRPEATETIAEVRVPLAEAVEAVLDSRITHGPSCGVILKAACRLGVLQCTPVRPNLPDGQP